MHRELAKRLFMALILQVFLLVGCSDDKAPARVQESQKASRLFDSQRSALEEAKAVADSVEQRNQRFPERAKDID